MRSISRTGVVVALFLVTILVFSMMLLSPGVLRAQETTMMGGETTMTQEDTQATPEPIVPGPDEECPEAEVVNTTTGTGNKQSPVFNVEGDSFRVTTTVDPRSGDPEDAGVTVFVVDAETREDVESFSAEGAGTDSSIINAGPGEFFLDLSTANANYAVVVEDCVGESQGGTDESTNDNNDEDTNNDGVIDDTIPDKDLPDTGGSAALIVGGSALLLLYVGFVAWRLKTRER